MDLIHIITVVILIVLGVVIYKKKKNEWRAGRNLAKTPNLLTQYPLNLDTQGVLDMLIGYMFLRTNYLKDARFCPMASR